MKVASVVRLDYIQAFNGYNDAYMSFSERLKRARVDKGLSQSELGKLANVHYTQVGRYENKGAQPSADVLSKLADALGTSTDFLMYGSQEELAGNIGDKELMAQFKRIAELPNEKKAMIKEFLDAFLLKNDIQQKLAQ